MLGCVALPDKSKSWTTLQIAPTTGGQETDATDKLENAPRRLQAMIGTTLKHFYRTWSVNTSLLLGGWSFLIRIWFGFVLWHLSFVRSELHWHLQLDPLRRSSVKIGTIQRRLAWPLRKDDTHKSRSVSDIDRDIYHWTFPALLLHMSQLAPTGLTNVG